MTAAMRWMSGAAIAAALAAFVLVGCKAEEEAPPAPPPDTSEALPDGLILTAAPEGALEVAPAKTSVKEGDEIVIRGKVGGSAEPFVAGRAIMTIADLESLVSCDNMPDDACPKPWDYCCEDPTKITAGTATIQVTGPDGKPLKADLKGAGGIAELKIVRVKGVVGPRPDPAVLVVNATGIYIEP